MKTSKKAQREIEARFAADRERDQRMRMRLINLLSDGETQIMQIQIEGEVNGLTRTVIELVGDHKGLVQ